ncbi:hypothetical protein [Litchfieldella qijiaojingensis]|uniref:hypothetical protein n=1 Tax=Litchfieldella qijiaojingensis TaxID=980347 RepID=UPI00167285AA|nr:hypothetical protein [Halomonas qijiaojingensis]
MNIEARFRRRAVAGENIADLNRVILGRLSKVKGFWADNKALSDAYFDDGKADGAATDLSSCLCSEYKGAISYAPRWEASIVDKAKSDDFVTIAFDSDKVNFKWFINEVFPKIVKAFLPYRAMIVADLDKDLDDFEDICIEAQNTGLDVDGRDTVFRVHPVNYFDNELCLRAFNMSADKVIQRLTGTVNLVEKCEDGVLLYVVDKPAIGDELVALDEKVRQMLTS